MRGATSRALRKALGYHPKNNREYKKYSVVGKIYAPVLDTNEKGNYHIVKYAPMDINRKIVECVSGDRKIYKLMKRRYVNPDYVSALTKLPGEEVENSLLEQAITEIKETENE